MDLLEYECPNSWQKEIVKQGFDKTNANIPTFCEFCERQEKCESIDPHNHNNHNNNSPDKAQKGWKNKNSKKRRATCDNSSDEESHNIEQLNNQLKKVTFQLNQDSDSERQPGREPFHPTFRY